MQQKTTEKEAEAFPANLPNTRFFGDTAGFELNLQSERTRL